MSNSICYFKYNVSVCVWKVTWTSRIDNGPRCDIVNAKF